MASQPIKPTSPNLEDDDLDDLDDVLDQFNIQPAPKSSSSSSNYLAPPSPTAPTAPPPTATLSATTTTTTTTTTQQRLRTNTVVDKPTSEEEEAADLLSADFARELASGMESLMREISGQSGGKDDADGDEDGGDEEERARTFKAAWEAMLVEGLDGSGAGLEGLGLGELLGSEGVGVKAKTNEAKAGASGSGSEKAGAGGDNFQDKIKQAMDKLKVSEENLQAGSATPKPSSVTGAGGLPSAESLESLLASLRGLDGEEGGEPDENELAGFIENMMGQLMSKEVLYEPLKELADNFPAYLKDPTKQISEEDRTRYNNQLTCVGKIVAVFEDPAYSDTDDEKKEVVNLMSEMQSYGSPPAEIMGELPPGLGGLGLPGGADENCVVC